jgi:uncharacterized protein with PIN domain
MDIAAELRIFVATHRRTGGAFPLTTDGTSTLGHVVEAAGIPLTEVGALTVNGKAAGVSYVPQQGDLVDVAAVVRPQALPADVPLKFLLDVHLGTLARRMRLLGLDTAYENQNDDEDLAAQSEAEQRVMLTRDRGLLHRRQNFAGAYIYSDQPDAQLNDVLERFSPKLDPWTRCTACNGTLKSKNKDEVEASLLPGTERTYDVFAQCGDCDRVYWRGAHHERLEAIVADAVALLS